MTTTISRPSINPLLLANNAVALFRIRVFMCKSAISTDVSRDALGEPGDSVVIE